MQRGRPDGRPRSTGLSDVGSLSAAALTLVQTVTASELSVPARTLSKHELQ